MHFQTTFPTALTTLLLSTLTVAAPAPQTTVTPGATITWPITNFTLGCSPAHPCYYSFIISGADTGAGFPEFSTRCSGSEAQQGMAPCEDPNVQAQLKSSETDTNGPVLFVNWYGPQPDGVTGIESGNATVEGRSNFVVEAKFYGEIVN